MAAGEELLEHAVRCHCREEMLSLRMSSYYSLHLVLPRSEELMSLLEPIDGKIGRCENNWSSKMRMAQRKTGRVEMNEE